MRRLSVPGRELARPDAGGYPGHAERHVRWASRASRHRRQERRFRERQHRLRMYVFALPAAVGAVLLVREVTAPTPIPAMVILGIVLVLPFLTEATNQPGGPIDG